MTLSRRDALTGLLATIATLASGTRVWAQTDWPNKPLRIIVPATAGASTDGLARIFAEHLKNAIGQSVVVENKPGGNQTIGISAMMSSPADGYSLLLSSTEIVRAPLLYPNIKYDPFKEFIPLTQIAATSTFLAVPTSLPVNNLKEFIEHAKKSPTPLSVGSPGLGSGAHYYTEVLARATGAPLSHVPYRGEVPLVPDLLAGRVAGGWISGNLCIQYSKENKIRVIGAGSIRNRAKLLPDVPTFLEAGVPGLDIAGFIGLWALAGTPAPIVNRLSTELARIAARPDVRAQIENIYGFESTGGTTSEQFSATMRGSHENWVRTIKQVNIKLE